MFLSLFEEISHESVRIYYHRLKVLKQPRKKERKLVAIDETKLKLETDLCMGCYRCRILRNA